MMISIDDIYQSVDRDKLITQLLLDKMNQLSQEVKDNESEILADINLDLINDEGLVTSVDKLASINLVHSSTHQALVELLAQLIEKLKNISKGSDSNELL